MFIDYLQAGSGANQRRINPALTLGAEVHCVPNDVDLIVTDFNTAQKGTICAYWQHSYIDVEMASGKTYTLNINQVSACEAH